MPRRGPLSESYAGAAAMVVLCLVPYLALTAAVIPLTTVIAKSLHMSASSLDITIGMSTAAYAVGTVLAVQFAVHLPARRMLLLYVTMFAAAAVVTAWSPNGGVFIGGFIAQGFCTSLMLIAAVPPLITGFGHEKMPTTGIIMNLCIFGAVAAGPTLGAIQASSSGNWRPLFWGVAGLAVLALILTLLTYKDSPPVDKSAPWDLVAVGLAIVGCSLAFFGASELEATGTVGIGSIGPLVAGAAMIAALIAYEYRIRRPLMPVKQLATTFPLFGILTAACASAASFGLMELVLTSLAKTSSPTTTGLYYLPEFGAAVLMAVVFGALFTTRYTPVLALSGLVVIVGAAALLLEVITTSSTLIAVATGMLGLGVGASVSPALFVAGFSLRSSEVQRVFALVELLRGVTAFLVAPILVFLATVIAASPSVGLVDTVWICLGIAAAGALAGAGLLWAGRARLQVPDLARWQETTPAWDSPPPFARFRALSQGDAREDESGENAAGEHTREDSARADSADGHGAGAENVRQAG